MKSHIAKIGIVLAVVLAGLGLNGVFAQQAPVKRNFEAEIQKALSRPRPRPGSSSSGYLGSDVPFASERRRKYPRQCAGLHYEPRQRAGA